MALKEILEVAVVDDTAVSRGLLVNCLEEIGIRNIEIFKNGEDALDHLKKMPRHLVVSDFNMPKLDGLGLLEGLRTYEPTSRIGFVLVTGRADPDMIQKGQSLHMNNYLEKPVDTKKMKACIEAIVGGLD
jgi:two-component system chemotaxis response regulator CheY